MNIKTFLFLLLTALSLESLALSYRLAKESHIKWTGKKVTGQHWGTVNFSQGVVEFKEGVLSGGRFTIDMASIDSKDLTGSSKDNLDGHLKSPDFFDVATHKEASFVVSKVEKKEGNTYLVTGQLTIKGQSHEESLTAIVYQKGETLRGEGKLVFDRTKYGIKYYSGKFIKDLGDKLIYDDIELSFDLTGEKIGRDS